MRLCTNNYQEVCKVEQSKGAAGKAHELCVLKSKGKFQVRGRIFELRSLKSGMSSALLCQS